MRSNMSFASEILISASASNTQSSLKISGKSSFRASRIRMPDDLPYGGIMAITGLVDDNSVNDRGSNERVSFIQLDKYQISFLSCFNGAPFVLQAQRLSRMKRREPYRFVQRHMPISQ